MNPSERYKSSVSEDRARSRLAGSELEIFRLVRRGASPRQWAEWLQAPLEHAAAAGDADLVTRLLDAGADARAGWHGSHGRTMLGAAAQGKSDDIVLALMRAGGSRDVNVSFGRRRETPLVLAARRGAEDAARTLLMAGADPRAVDVDGVEALHMAASHGQYRLVTDLLLRGAKVNDASNNGNLAIHQAAIHGHSKTVCTLLASRADAEALNEDGDSPLLLAVHGGHVCAAEKLLAFGVDISMRYSSDISPTRSVSVLGIASLMCDAAMVELLLEHGADIRSRPDGWNALHCVADAPPPPDDDGDGAGVVRALVNAGADIHSAFEGSWTPLLMAARGENTSSDVMRALIQEGANLEARGIYGRTPLHETCRCLNVEAVELLLRHGADETALMYSTSGHGRLTPAGLVSAHLETEENEESIADCYRLLEMLARVPADRAWRRRGWLVLARSHPDRVRVAGGRLTRSGRGRNRGRARVSSSGEGGAPGTQAGFARLMRSLVEIREDALFRNVISFL